MSGAGAVSRNVVLTRTNALLDNSTVTTATDVAITAANTSRIDATVAAASVAIGAGSTTGVGASIGISIAENLIGWTLDATRTPAEVQAISRNSGIRAGGEFFAAANNAAKIDAVVLAGSVAIAGGGSVGVGVSGAGVSATNQIATTIKAAVDGDDDDAQGTASVAGIQAAQVRLQANDVSSIQAIGGAATIAAAFGGVGVALSVGVAIADNHVSNNVEASISRADDGIVTTVGDVIVAANTVSSIDAITVAASLAIGGGGTGIALSGAGADASNVILSRTNAFIATGSVVDSKRHVDLDAAANSEIQSFILGVSAAVGIGGSAGVGASVGAALARNFIGWDPREAVATVTTDDERKTITAGTKVKVLSGIRKGDVYEYIGKTASTTYDFLATQTGETTLTNDDDDQTRVLVVDPTKGRLIYVWQGDDDEKVNLSGMKPADFDAKVVDRKWEANDDWRLERVASLAGEDYGDTDLWKLVLPPDLEDASQVRAFISNASVTAAGDLTIDALATGSIDAQTFAGSLAVGGGGMTGLAGAGAGVGVENRVRTVVRAAI